jgi:hypothetical protein
VFGNRDLYITNALDSPAKYAVLGANPNVDRLVRLLSNLNRLLGERPGLSVLAGVVLVTLGATISLRDQIKTCVPISTTRFEGMEK